MGSKEDLRKLPSVDALLKEATVQYLTREHGREVVVWAVREVLEETRQAILEGAPLSKPSEFIRRVTARVSEIMQPSLQPAINATGVIIHTNLGRAPLSEAAREAMQAVARSYSNLEYDLEAGQRGSRYHHAQALLTRLTGAESALVVNNNASALLLILSALARGREVIISRGQLVEIGGGFRIPEVMAQSGATLVEVGTTNRTYARDYERAITERTAAILRVHHSNFRMVGFTQQATLSELTALARQNHLLAIDDLGSGALLDTAQFGLAHEPTPQESIAQGADLVCFSGDKLLGGPQAGIILGRADLIASLREHPLARALRVDKLTLAALQANLLHYLRSEALEKVPVWRMIAWRAEELHSRAVAWSTALGEIDVATSVIEGHSPIGGGSLPGETLPTYLLAIDTPAPDALAARLRASQPPVIARVEEGRLVLDPRTVLPEEDAIFIDALCVALNA